MVGVRVAITRTGEGRIPRGRKVVRFVEGEIEWFEMECNVCGLVPIFLFKVDRDGGYRPYCRYCDPEARQPVGSKNNTLLNRIKAHEQKVEGMCDSSSV